MYFKSISLTNFRNYSSLYLDFNPKLNLILGQNANGKTNLLEGLFIMGLGRSFRTNTDKDMIMFGKNFSFAHAVVYDEDRLTDIKISYQRDGKIIRLNDVKLDRTVDLLESVYIVVFSPEDLRIVKDGPDNRRKFLDRELCQIKPVYYSDLGNYKRVLKQRNVLLKQQNRDMALYEVFDQALADYGIRIASERRSFTQRLQEISKKIHYDISGAKENIVISYESKISEDIESYRKLLSDNFESDLYRGYTSFGPHKDDLKIEVDGIDIRNFGSQGQQRTAALSMKLAEISLIKQETGKDAVLLLDDVLSELDNNRQRFLIDSMRDVQVFITATEIDTEILKLLPKGNKFLIEEGNAKILT